MNLRNARGDPDVGREIVRQQMRERAGANRQRRAQTFSRQEWEANASTFLVGILTLVSGVFAAVWLCGPNREEMREWAAFPGFGFGFGLLLTAFLYWWNNHYEG